MLYGYYSTTIKLFCFIFVCIFILNSTVKADTSEISLLGVANSAVPYKSVGDLGLPTATAWWGFRAYSNAYALSIGKIVNVRRASDSATKDITSLANGAFDSTTAANFAGTDATATCSTSGSSTTLSCTGASKTPSSFDPIYGTGINEPAFIMSCGTFTGGAGTCTMNVAQNISSTTITFQVALYITKLYDQTLGNHCGGSSCDLVQATPANQIQLLLNCLGVNHQSPCAMFPTSASSISQQLLSASNFTPATGVVTFEGITERLASSPGSNILRENGGNNRFNINSANLWSLTFTVGTFTATAADGTLHLGVAVATGASSKMYIDNVSSSGSVTGNTTAGQISTGVNSTSSSETYTGEIGFWDNSAFTSTQAGTLHTNVSSYYNTP